MANEENECKGLIVAINQRLVMESVQDSSAEPGCSVHGATDFQMHWL